MPVKQTNQKYGGFTLIEMVIGITTFALALTIINSVLAPQITRSVDPIYNVRATELAQSMFNEILGKYYDEESDRNGGRIRCNEDLTGDDDYDDTSDGEVGCTISLGPESGESGREDFDDIDDYNGYYEDEILQNSLGQNMVLDTGEELYANFIVEVSVFYDSDLDHVPNSDEVDTDQQGTGNIKSILLTITTPSGESLQFSSFKHNY